MDLNLKVFAENYKFCTTNYKEKKPTHDNAWALKIYKPLRLFGPPLL
jgi:hypothetical protein